MTREADAPSGKGTLAVRTSLDVPLVAATRVCRSCGKPAHILNDCPAFYFTDTNTDHFCNWADSIVGKAWSANGENMWQERLVLPGYEIRERFHPAASPPFLICDNNEKETRTKVMETRATKTQVIKTKVRDTKVTKTVTQVVVGNTRGRIPEGANTTHPKGDSTLPLTRQNKTKVCTTDDVDTSDDYVTPTVSVITNDFRPLVLIPEEFLHMISTTPSEHLNVTVSVQDKEREKYSSVRRMVGKAVLDTASYSEDFIPYNMIVKLKAIIML